MLPIPELTVMVSAATRPDQSQGSAPWATGAKKRTMAAVTSGGHEAEVDIEEKIAQLRTKESTELGTPTMQRKIKTLTPSAASDLLDSEKIVEKVLYKGFVNCDHPTRTPNEFTVEGIHTIFTSKKQMKQAQDDNPLAGRGFKKPVILMAMIDGFRIDMVSSKENDALLHGPANKIVYSKAIDRHVYVVMRRGKRPGKYSCHCITAGKKQPSLPEDIARYMTKLRQFHISTGQAAQSDTPSGSQMVIGDLSGRGRPMSIRDNAAAARLRKTSEANVGGELELDAPQQSSEGYLDDVQATTAQEYLDDGPSVEPGNVTKRRGSGDEGSGAGLEAKPWFHGAIGRPVAEQRLAGHAAGSFLIRVSSDGSGYSLSLMTRSLKVRHFKIVGKDGGRWLIHGHSQGYSSVSGLVMHYSANDITADGDRCVEPCTRI